MQDTSIRLKKVIGQLNGIMKMLDSNTDCEKVTVQFQAAQAALSSAFADHLNSSLHGCMETKDQEQIKKILKLIAKN
jgi:DNA-binding FrmR family transcriptional regulator